MPSTSAASAAAGARSTASSSMTLMATVSSAWLENDTGSISIRQAAPIHTGTLSAHRMGWMNSLRRRCGARHSTRRANRAHSPAHSAAAAKGTAAALRPRPEKLYTAVSAAPRERYAAARAA